MRGFMKAIYLYLVLTFIFGIFWTRHILEKDTDTAPFENPRVNLVCSYWYERFNYTEVLTWYSQEVNQPLAVGVTDKLATGIYGNMFLTSCAKNESFVYILTSYPATTGVSLERVNKHQGFVNIYRIRGKS